MKQYIKPNLDLKSISFDKELANAGLSGWLDANLGGDYDQVVTTYQVVS